MNVDDRTQATGTAGGGPAHSAPPPGAKFMNGVRWALFAGLLLLAVVSIGAYVVSRRAPATGAEVASAKPLYRCPMHPSYTSDKPGDCPICGMALEKVEPAAAGGAVAHPGDVPGLAPVELSAGRTQMIGVRTAVVQRRSMGEALELVGFVAPDESRLQRIQLRVSGWVRRLHVSRTGQPVRAGETLLTLYSPELYQTEQEFLIETHATDDLSAMAHDATGTPATIERLRLLGVPAAEIERLRRERRASTELAIPSPVSGTVMERGVTEGQYVSADTPLFTLADLSRVWVLADLYEMELGRVKAGEPASFTADGLPGRTFPSRIEFVYPTVSSETRTVKARLVIANAGGALRPGMFGHVRLGGRSAPGLVIPSEALVDAGDHRYVFLAHAGGHFEPRMVTVGVEQDDDAQILAGLAEGDTVVASASFLIDSESRLKAAIAGMASQPAAGHSGH